MLARLSIRIESVAEPASGREEANPVALPSGRLHHSRCHSCPGTGGSRQASAAAVTVGWK
jgi:hypothetical protein